MHEFGDRVAQEVFNLKNFDSYDRLDWLAGAMGCSNNSAEDFVFYSRQWLIDLAEKALVPTFTRAVFAHAIADQIMANPETKFAIEVFKQEEFELLVNRLHSTGCLKKAFCFNLRRLEEDPLIDGRTLLSNAIEINNDSTYENLAELIANFLSCR
jgi:hypothetical protein